ncbi:MAG TPA: hypothetical protein DDX19_19600 [Rhodopirellula baltica]|uniref:Uncharacterized protein n=1 Tax=Rhodopirellula baltica (strain DSM 10527 / NCIMB 13988 / SH1) TaxID=243090 RepID=Q7UPR3_RHOBA|nr:hypothetical protein [Rhodopirellula baltica]CAD74998.1 hypothetical protein RB6774 [Rhodopirellula baltica SH 1]HBE64913.1 hypothetical protein [Rhodopirellula baltica]
MTNSTSKHVTPNSSPASRRAFLGRLVAIGGMAGTLGTSKIAAAAGSSTTNDVILRPRLDLGLYRVRMEMDVKGNVNLTKDPLLALTAKPSTKQQLPITAKVALDYEERYLRPKNADMESPIIAAERHYHSAQGVSRLSRMDQTTELRDNLGLVVARRDTLPEAIYASDDYLNHDELDLLRTPIASVALDRLLPTQTLSIGEKVALDSNDLASVFNLSGVVKSDVEISLVSNDASNAKLQFQGKMDGSVSGVPTQLRVLGKLTFQHSSRTVTWAAVAIHETREIGMAEPGFDVTATIRMIRKPLEKPQVLPSSAVAIDFDSPPPSDRMLMTVDCEKIGVSALLDRRWRIMQDGAGQAILRMIENEQSIAQCNLRALPRLPEGNQLTLEAFEADVQRTLDKQLDQLVRSEEQLSDSGLRVLHITATGEVEGIPIQWIMMHFSDDSGRRVQATLTMEGESVNDLNGSDVQLAASLQWAGPAVTAGEENDLDPAEKSGLDGTETASSAGQQLRLDAADLVDPSKNRPEHVISASDLPTTKR